MKYLILLAVISLAMAAPQHGRREENRFPDDVPGVVNAREYRSDPEDVNAEILDSHLEHGPEHGQFKYGFKTSNRIEEDRRGELLDEGGQYKEGYFLIPLDDGSDARFEYEAGLHGYVVNSDFLHPMPAHALEQIRMAEQMRAEGVEWDQRGFRI